MHFVKNNKKFIIAIVILLVITIIALIVGAIGINHKSKSNTETEKQYNFIEPTEELKEKYEIKSEKIIENGTTKIKGSVKSNNKTTNTIQIVAKLYKEDGKLAIVSQTVVEKIKNNETRNFEIVLNGNYEQNEYNLELEYIEN